MRVVPQIGLALLPAMMPITTIEDAQTLAQAIMNTVPEPFIVLDDQFCVVAASRSFYQTFGVDPEHTLGNPLHALGEGQWDIPALRLLLEKISSENNAMDGFEVDHDFPHLGRRIMQLNARKVLYDHNLSNTILLSFTDVTTRRTIELEKADLLRHTEELLRQKDILLQEMQHRVANSLQIIASILLLKARAVTSEETRHHLQDAHQRVMSVATVQRHLHATVGIDQIEVSSYLSKLCGSLASSMIGENQAISVKVMADEGMINSSGAVSIGLIVTELMINAIKYAFPLDRADALVLVSYEIDGPDWKLTVSDNGVGKSGDETNAGLGTAIVKALVKQLDARMEVVSSRAGMSVSITRATFTSRAPRGA